MLISPGNTLKDTPRNNVELGIWASHSPVKVTHKANHHMQHQYLTDSLRNTVLGHHLRPVGSRNLCSNLLSRWGSCTWIFAKHCFRGPLCLLSLMPFLMVCSHPWTSLYRDSKTLCLESFQNLRGCVSRASCLWGLWMVLVYVKVSIHEWDRRREGDTGWGLCFSVLLVLNLNLSSGSF